MERIAVLGFGSLLIDPGEELARSLSDCREVSTPFSVEYARYSKSRGGAPTLVPVDGFGGPVRARLLILRGETTLKDAQDMLWRRETRQIDPTKGYVAQYSPIPNALIVQELRDFEGVGRVLYADFPAAGKAIERPDPAELARRAIGSVHKAPDHRDGITYLMDAKKSGVETELTPAYEKLVLELTGAGTLRDALNAVRQSATAG